MTAVLFPGGLPLEVLPHRAARHDFGAWEREYIQMLVSTLRPDMTVYEIGAEQGEFGALAASIVGSERVHLFEPSTTSWPNIKAVFDLNGLRPAATYHGFVGLDIGPFNPCVGAWPIAAVGDVRTGDADFYVATERPDIASVSLDRWISDVGAPPDVVMIDVEGAEVNVIAGAHQMLTTYRPIVFVSVHPPDFIGRFPAQPLGINVPNEAPGCQQEHLFRLFSAARYRAQWLHTDHESHWMFVPT